MLTIPQYLIESSFCLLLFYGFYHLFLKKETFFQLNRAYLIGTPILSLGIPLINISFQKDAPAESLEAFFYPAIQSAHNLNHLVWEQMRAPTPVFSLSVADVIMAVYLLGVFLMGFSLLKGLWNLSRLIRQGKQSKNKDFTLIETQKNFPAASFFGYIFWNQQITDEQKLILEHEKVHIRQWHSLDVFLMEICVILKWFNPLIYWFRNALKATHEYIADQFVIQQKSNIRDYATLLVQQQQNTATSLTNTFYSMTKKRLKMMLQQPSKKANAAKYLLVFPLITSLLLLFSFNLIEVIPQVSEGLDEMNSVLSNIGEKTVFEIEKSKEKLYDKEVEKLLSDNQLKPVYQMLIGETPITLKSVEQTLNSLPNEIDNIDFFQQLRSGNIRFFANAKPMEMQEIRFILPTGDGSYNQNIDKDEKGKYFVNDSYDIAPVKLITKAENNFIIPKEAINNFEELVNNAQLNKTIMITGINADNVFTAYLNTVNGNITGNNSKNKEESTKNRTVSVGKNNYLKFKWGNIETPIWHRDNPSYSGNPYKFVTKEDFIQNLSSTIEIYNGGKKYDAKSINFNFYFKNEEEKSSNQQLFTFSLILESSDFTVNLKKKSNWVLPNKKQELLLEKIEDLSHILVTIPELSEFHTLFIRIGDKKEYKAPVSINDKKTYHYQVIVPDKDKTILKIDTTLPANKKIVSMYRNPKKYEIVHIPNFKTKERLVVENQINSYYSSEEKILLSPYFESINKPELQKDVIGLPEYTDFKSTDLTLKWGDLTANPKSINYDLRTFLLNHRKPVKLFHKGKVLKINGIRAAKIENRERKGTFNLNKLNGKAIKLHFDNLSTANTFHFSKIIIEVEGQEYYLPQNFLFNIGHEVIENSNMEIPITANKINKPIIFDVLNNIHPFFYYNQMTLGNPLLNGNKYSYHLEKYEQLNKKYQKNDQAVTTFGNAGEKGVFATYLKLKKKELGTANFEKDSPLQLVFFGDTFYFMTHKLSFENFDVNNFLRKQNFPPDSKLAKWFGESGKNGVVIIRLAAPTHFEKPSQKNDMGKVEHYELRWGNHPLPIIYNKETNATVARFITKNDFLSKINEPLLFYKNGQLLENKRVQLTLFDANNGSSWGIDKMGGNKFKYWDFLKGNYAHFELNTSKKQGFNQEEITTIKSLLKEGWLLTFRTEDDFQLYTSISIVEPFSILLTKQ